MCTEPPPGLVLLPSPGTGERTHSDQSDEVACAEYTQRVFEPSQLCLSAVEYCGGFAQRILEALGISGSWEPALQESPWGPGSQRLYFVSVRLPPSALYPDGVTGTPGNLQSVC